MSVLEILRSEYPGHEAWEKFCLAVSGVHFPDMLEVTVDRDIFAVATRKIGSADKACEWLQKEIPALDGKTVNQVFEFEHNGREIVRSLLMRLP